MWSVSLLAVSRACEGTEVTKPRCTTVQSSPGWVKRSNWVLGGRQVLYFRLHEQFVIERQLCPDPGLLNTVHPLLTVSQLRNTVIFLRINTVSSQKQQTASSLQPASCGPPAVEQSITVCTLAGTRWCPVWNTHFLLAPAFRPRF